MTQSNIALFISLRLAQIIMHSVKSNAILFGNSKQPRFKSYTYKLGDVIINAFICKVREYMHICIHGIFYNNSMYFCIFLSFSFFFSRDKDSSSNIRSLSCMVIKDLKKQYIFASRHSFLCCFLNI